MNKIFFSSTYFGESGPCEVNRNLVENFPKGKVCCLCCHNRYLIRLEIIIKIIWCKVLIISALGEKDYEVKLAKFLGKKIIYIMHGLAEDDSKHLLDRQNFLLPRADLILCVSAIFKDLVKTKHPEISGKLDVLYNGIAWEKINDVIKMTHKNRNPREIALIGGGRFIKRNLNVCKAVQLINNWMNLNLHVSVYGQYNEVDESEAISKIDCVTFVGFVHHKELLERLCATSLLIQASVSESFGLAVVESLVCGCNIVVSKNVGAIGIIPAISRNEIINDPENLSEIAKCINFVLENPNNKRLLESIDKKGTSLQTAAHKLLEFAHKV